MSEIVRKSDNVIQITVNGSDGNPLTISDLSGLEITVYQGAKKIIQQWTTADGNITTVDNTAGIVSVNLDRTKLSVNKTNIDKIFLEVAALFVDADFTDGIRREVDTAIELALVEDSPTAYLT